MSTTRPSGGWRGALGLLSAVPVRSGAPGPADAAWYGPVGAALGVAVGTAWWVGTQAWTPLVGAALAVTADLAVTGLLHLDGLADAGDGLLAPMDRARRLAVMAGPEVGAFGVATVGAVLALRIGALSAAEPHVVPVMGLWAASRAGAAMAANVIPAARPGGLGAALAPPDTAGSVEPPRSAGPSATDGRPGVRPAVLAAAATLVVAWGACAWSAPGPGAGWAAVPVLVAAMAAVLGLARRRLGGQTGDVLGAAIVVGETAGLLALGAHW